MPLRLRSSTAAAVPPNVALATPGDSLCGYRLVRKLGDGLRAEVFLGFGEAARDGGDPTTVAVKVCRAATAVSASTELEAIARAEHPHIVRLVDAATTPSGGTCIVLERLSRGSLAHLLERRPELEAGEVVTIVAPIAAAIGVMHDSGVLHGSIGPSAVLFRESGAPVIARFGRASLIQPGLPPVQLAPLAAADRAAMGELAATLLDRVDDARAAELARWARESHSVDRFGEQLVERLFGMATASPVSFDDSANVATAVPARVAVHHADHADHRQRSRRSGANSAGLAAAVAGIIGRLRVVRTPVWVGAASVLVAIIAAIVLVPGGASDAPANARSIPTPVNSPPTGAATTDPASPTSVADPIAALGALIVARRACMDDLSVICLDGVDQSGSAALDDDADLIRGVRAGGELPEAARLGAVSPKLVERLGDSALIELEGDGKPASVLMIRTEAGWRLRDYLD